MTTAQETWHTVPDHPDYEVSSRGRVRSFKSPNGKGPTANKARLLSGKYWHGQRYYTLDGQDLTIDDIMLMTLEEAEATDLITRRDRTLTEYELREIRDAEGYKPAHDVAEDFQLDHGRVLNIWNGMGE